jgi:hypothetical protein
MEDRGRHRIGISQNQPHINADVAPQKYNGTEELLQENAHRMVSKLHIWFYGVYRQNFRFSGHINKFWMKLRHFKNAYFAYLKHLEHILAKNAY